MEKPYTSVEEVDYKMITTHPYFKTLSLEELADVIGFMEHEGYNKLEGEYSTDKAKILFEKFNPGKMEKKLIGYNIKPEFKDNIVTIARALDTVPYNFPNGIFMSPDKAIADRAKKLNVLDLWFDPVYEESLKPGDYVKWTGKYPTYGIIDKKYTYSRCYVLRCTIKEGLYNSCDSSFITKVTEEEYFDALIAEAEKRYPKGTKFVSHGYKHTSTGKADKGAIFDRAIRAIFDGVIRVKNVNGSGLFYRDGWAEIIKAPVIEINGYKGEFFDAYVKFGGAEISKEVFIDLATITEYDNTNRSVESVTIGKGVFTKAQIQEIANYYQ